MLPPEDGVWCAGGGDDNIRAITGLIELLKQNHLAVKFPRQLRRALMSTIGYEDRSCPVGHQVARSQFAHLPCANEIDVSSLKRPENLLCQLDRNRGNRYCRRSDGGFRPDSLGNSKSPRQQQIKLRMDCTHRACRCICLFHLAQKSAARLPPWNPNLPPRETNDGRLRSRDIHKDAARIAPDRAGNTRAKTCADRRRRS